jgi:2-dehydro-3-deoxy-D-arabinonate dehydratase
VGASPLTRFVRVRHGRGARVGLLGDDGGVDVVDHDDPLRAIEGGGEVVARLDAADVCLLPPIEAPEIWCAGVTYERSRDARVEESRTDARDVYALVYEADRPELFLKDAQMRRTVGPGGPIRLRGDSKWTVPEPELGIVLGEGREPVAVTVGNDVSSRDIEGENPLYLPQAKIFAGACAIGPALAVPADWDAAFEIRLRITSAGGDELFAGETSTARMRRSPHELAAWATRDNPIPAGSVLLTGTGLVPPDDYTLEPGHIVSIEIPGIGELVNTVAPR